MNRSLGLALLLCGLVTGLFAQNSSSITGTVRDASGAVIPGAQVVVADPAKGISQSATTNSNGEYLVGGLDAGTYNLSVSNQGFKKYDATGIILRVAQHARVDATLELGAINTEVSVQGTNVAQVETQNA
jgi:hypothetical protein